MLREGCVQRGYGSGGYCAGVAQGPMQVPQKVLCCSLDRESMGGCLDDIGG